MFILKMVQLVPKAQINGFFLWKINPRELRRNLKIAKINAREMQVAAIRENKCARKFMLAKIYGNKVQQNFLVMLYYRVIKNLCPPPEPKLEDWVPGGRRGGGVLSRPANVMCHGHFSKRTLL